MQKQEHTGCRRSCQDVPRRRGLPAPSGGAQSHAQCRGCTAPTAARARAGTAMHPATRSTSFPHTCGILMSTGLASTFQRADIMQTLFSDHTGIELKIQKKKKNWGEKKKSNIWKHKNTLISPAVREQTKIGFHHPPHEDGDISQRGMQLEGCTQAAAAAGGRSAEKKRTSNAVQVRATDQAQRTREEGRERSEQK